jgi:hypothetical protein
VLARAYVVEPSLAVPPQSGGRDRVEAVVEHVRARGAEAVILAAATCCNVARMERMRLGAVLDSAGIPFLFVNYTENAVDETALHAEAAKLARGLRRP